MSDPERIILNFKKQINPLITVFLRNLPEIIPFNVNKLVFLK